MLRSIFLALIPLALAACPPGDGGGDASAGNTTTTDGDSNATVPTEGGGDPGFNPDYRQILSGTTVDAVYTKVRVGQLDVTDVDGCCTDFVLAGPAQNHVKILFGTSSRGLLFLSDVPDQTFSMGPTGVGIEDIVVADINADGFDDVLALRSDGMVGIRHGLGATAPAPVLSATLLETSLAVGTNKGARSLAVTDINCMGKNDLIAVSPSTDGVVYAVAAPGDTFSSPLFFSTGLESSPRQIIAGDLNGDNQPDIVTGNGDGSASVMLNTCGTLALTKFPIFDTGEYETPDMQIAIGRVCLGASAKDWPAIALGYDQRVFIFCGSSGGTYDAVDEEPVVLWPARRYDYVMNINPQSPVLNSAVYQLQYWEPTQSLLVLWSDDPEEFAVFDPSAAGSHMPLVNLHGRTKGSAFAAHQSRTTGGPQWSQVVVLVPGAGFTDVSFTR
ncbi:MAG: hypothetical protein H0T76_20545 [Nannocystis sp.]|nr:hypothetical protein [Nannocystis sp.]